MSIIEVQGMNELTRATLFRDAADVKRYHTRRTIREQTVGAHSFGVMLLAQQVNPACRKEVLLAIMHHDLPEFFTGDLPAPIKRMSPTLALELEHVEEQLRPLYADWHLTPAEAKLVKWCDTMELILWCLEELELGNQGQGITECIENGMKWILEYPCAYEAQVVLRTEVMMECIDVGFKFTPPEQRT